MNKVKEYSVYLDNVREYLKAKKIRLLTEKEEEIVVDHLKVVAATYCSKYSKARNDANTYEGLGITQVLSIEAAKKVSELHEDIPEPTPAVVDQRVAEVLTVQNYLKQE